MRIKLNKRETYAVYTAAGLLGLFVLIQFVLLPLFERSERLQRQILVKTDALQKMRALTVEYEAIRKEAEVMKMHFAEREKGFSLFSFLDRLAGEANIKSHITYMKPSTATKKKVPFKTSMVEMKLQAVTMKQLTSYLHMIETSKNAVTLSTVSISRTSKPEGFIDAVLNVETFEESRI